MAPSTLITNARIFDGENIIAEGGFILFEKGLIKEIGTVESSVTLTADITIDASGHTILPGLIDAHVHIHEGSIELAQALKFGVTTVLDLFNEPENIAKLKRESSKRPDIADIKSACYAATIKDGWPRPVILATMEDKEAVRFPNLGTRGAEYSGSLALVEHVTDKLEFSYIKLMHESGACLLGNPLPLPSHELQSALVQAAHKHGLITIAHALSQKDTLAILAAGTDGLAHSFCDEAPRDELLAAYRKYNSFLVPTLVISATLTGAEKPSTERFVRHPFVGKFLDSRMKTCYCGRIMMGKEGCKSEYSYQIVRMLNEGGIDIVAGTDAATGLEGTAIGLSLHQELSLYVERCGMTPLQALRSATSTTARRFSFEDRGRLVKGMRADVLMVKGDPTKDISRTLEIGGIWRGGVALDMDN
ncbi:hypothetical protein OIDMADRAFT_150433 [Oidiodendron maius Zn]|uniref:Amidohydrolase-related domain-containing protein n=1 Tax=Oidiodendron maius (strain Zn) TaxID=913774 RepID=A0A0C3HG52_OIDMZ|nr:hypothetical protein OIDMADRAFT_150433 [Oidiodendron maius Zn]